MRKLTNTAKNHWDQPEELRHICRALQIGDEEIAHQFIEDNQNSIRFLYPFLVVIAPQLAVKKFNEGFPIELVSEHRCAINSYALYKLIETDKVVMKQFFL